MYLDTYLDPCAAYGWLGGPQGKTRVVQMANGRERRNAEWADVQHKFILPFLNISKEKYRAIKQLHLVCRQMTHCFRYRDHLDDYANSELFATGDGSSTEFQLSKLSVADGVFYQRNIYAIPEEPSDFVLTVDGVPSESFVLDRQRGKVDFDLAPALGAVLRWSGTFDLWVRFNQDWLPFSIDNIDACNGEVELIEMPPPQDVTS